MGPRLRMGIVSAAFAVVAVVAVIGWARKPVASTAYNPGPGNGWGTNPAVVQANAPSVDPTMPTAYSEQVGPNREDPAVNPCVQPGGYEYATPSYASAYGVRTVRQRVIEEQPRVEEQTRVYEEQPRVYEGRRVVRRHGRSTGKSVAIVAGSAGVGAAIGALAGGGKGAAIGALAGGGGGFVYDRLTHNR
jgi:hypothetical protein